MNIKLLYRVSLFFLCAWMLASLSCNKNNTTQVENGSISLTVEDASCIEAWLNVKIKDMILPQQLSLYENDSLKTNLILTSADTTIFTENLLPKKSYKWQLRGEKEKSNEATIVTMDTTSHNFTFETFTFGQHSSSVLYDVAIISENNIWAVGEIYMNDSLGNPDPHAYNAVHWDGQSWKLKRIMFYTICGQPSLSSYPAKTIFAFSENDVWIAGGGRQLARINGINQLEKICLPFSMVINKIWGSSSNDLYAVGNGGNIAHWDGSSWKKIESGTSLNINDIWGDYKLRTQEWEILAVAATYFTQPPTHILKLTKTEAKSISTSGIYTTSWGIWHQSEREYFIVGGGNYKRRSIMNSSFWLPMNELNQMYFCRAIRGTGFNDIVITGDFGTLYHYNGLSWKQFTELYGNKTFLAVAKNESLLSAVGWKGAEALILFGRMD